MDAITVPERVKTIMAMLNAAAENGEECPSNSVLSVGAGCKRDTAINAVSLLEAMGVITVERGRAWRVVTIVATGKKTKSLRKMAKTDRLTAFCDALADGALVGEAGRIAGVGARHARKLLQEVRRDLGWQAA